MISFFESNSFNSILFNSRLVIILILILILILFSAIFSTLFNELITKILMFIA